MPETTLVQVHLFAAARAAAGVPTLEVEAGSLGEVLDRLVVASPGLAAVLPRCSYLVDEVAARPSDLDREVPAGSRLDVLPPFAGGYGQALLTQGAGAARRGTGSSLLGFGCVCCRSKLLAGARRVAAASASRPWRRSPSRV